MDDHITTELHCAQCGYDLRTLPAGGRCPECGFAVSETLRLRKDAALRPRRAAAGVLLLLITAGIVLLLCIPPWREPTYIVRPIFALDLSFLHPWFVAASAFVPAVWLLSTGERRPWLSRLLSIAAWAGCAVIVVLVERLDTPIIRLLFYPSIGMTLLAIPAMWLAGTSLLRMATACAGIRLITFSRTARMTGTIVVALDLAWRLALFLDWTVGLNLYLGHRNAMWAKVVSRVIASTFWLCVAAFLPLGIILLRRVLAAGRVARIPQ